MPRPSTTQQINLRISEELLARIDAKAQEIGIDRSALLRMAATQFIEGTAPAPAVSASGETERALVLMLDRIEALEDWKETADKCIEGIPQLVAAVEQSMTKASDNKFKAFGEALQAAEKNPAGPPASELLARLMKGSKQ